MNMNNDPSKNNPWFSAFNMKTLTVGGEVGCVTLLIVIGSVFAGIWLDKLLGTKPVLTIFFVLGSAPLALLLTFWIATRAIKDIKPKDSSKGIEPNQANSSKGVEDQ